MNKIQRKISYLPDEEHSWKGLLALTKDKNKDAFMSLIASKALGSAFAHVTDKEQATKDLLALVKDENSSVRSLAAIALGIAFTHVTDKKQATKDLRVLTKDKDSNVRYNSANALGSAFTQVTNKEQVWIDLLILAKDKDRGVRWIAANAIGSAFAHVTNKEQATKNLLAMAKDEDNSVRMFAAIAFGSAFTHMTNKEQATKDLLTLVKDKDSGVRMSAANSLGLAFVHITDMEQAIKDLLALAKDKDSNVRTNARFSLFNLARHYLDEKDYEKTFQCFYGASIRSTLREHINPDPFFYSCRGLGSYYHGRVIVNELSNIKDPKEYTKSVKDAVRLFAKSIKYIEKSPSDEVETRFFPICLNIYSAYYEYILSFKKLDVKSVAKVEKYLDEASEQCRIIGTEKGERTVKIFEMLAETLKSRLKEIELEAKKREVNGIGRKADYQSFIDKSREDFEKHKIELENSLYEIEAPIIKKIAEFERKKLDKLKPEKGERIFQKSLGENSRDFVVQKWKIIIEILAAVATFLFVLTTIIEKWEIISELIKILI